MINRHDSDNRMLRMKQLTERHADMHSKNSFENYREIKIIVQKQNNKRNENTKQ